MPPSIKPSVKGDIVRGTSVNFTIEPPLPSDSPVRSWIFEETLSSGKVLQVKRPKREKRKTWQTSWKGQMVTSGKIVVQYEPVRKKVQDESGKVKWHIEMGRLEHAVNVVPRTGDDWRSTVTPHEEKPYRKKPKKFKNLGLHQARIKPNKPWSKLIPIKRVTSGPNKGYKFVDVLKLSFHSHTFINDQLLDPESKFSKAQDGNVYIETPRPRRPVKGAEYTTVNGTKRTVTVVNDEKFRKDHNIPVYKTKPKPRRRVDPNDWTISGGDVTAAIDDEKFRKKYGIPVYKTKPKPRRRVDPNDWTMSGGKPDAIDDDKFRKKYKIGNRAYRLIAAGYTLKPADYKLEARIRYEDLLEYTRRHEHEGNLNSHRANFVKMVRALDPKKYAESLIRRPGKKRNLRTLVKKRIKKIVLHNDKHGIVDEDATRINGEEKYKPKKWKVAYEPDRRIFDCNEDDNGNWVGNVWDPKKNKPFPSSPRARRAP